MAPDTRIAVIGDPHVAVPLDENDERLEVDPGRKLHGLSVELLTATIEEINGESDIDAVLIMGDMTRDSELFNHEIARDIVGGINAPHYIVTGNHDLKRERKPGVTYPGVRRLDLDEFARFYADAGLPGGNTRYRVDLPGGTALIVLDSNRTLHEMAADTVDLSRQDDGRIGEEQLAWLDETLADAIGSNLFPLVAVHHSIADQSPAEKPGHPLQFVFRSWQAEDSAEVRAVLAKHGVPLVLSGHLHAQSVGVEDGITNLVTSAAVSYPHCWRKLTIGADSISIESRPLAGIPSCGDLQGKSRAWLAEGMGRLIEEKASKIQMLSAFTTELGSFVTKSGWWTSFCDGSQAGFSVDKALVPNGNPIKRMVFGKVEQLLNEFGTWKSARPDPNTLEVALRSMGQLTQP
jgi:predicted phosphodiesterase